MEITSVNNELVKEYAKLNQKKYREETGKFLLEGYKAIKEAFDFGIKIDKIFVNKNHVSEYEFAKEYVIETNQAVLSKLSTTESAPEAVGIGYKREYDVELLKQSRKVVLLEGIKDAGNLGTIIRSSVAFGVDAIVLYGESVDLYNPKSVRASVGNLWKVPVVYIDKFEKLVDIFSDFKRIATLPRAKNKLKSFKATFPLLIMFGSEANGLSEELINFSTDSIKVEMSEIVESLNLASSVSVILYELFMI